MPDRAESPVRDAEQEGEDDRVDGDQRRRAPARPHGREQRRNDEQADQRPSAADERAHSGNRGGESQQP